MNNISLLAKNIIFYIVLIPITFLYAFLAFFTYPLKFSIRYKIITSWSHIFIFLVKTICGLKYEVIGKENITAQNTIILSKHSSTWEAIFMQVLFPPQNMILKKELLYIPLFGWGLSLLEPIALNRRDFRSADLVLKQGLIKLKQGHFVLMFPEGTRVPYGTRGRYSRTGAALAIHSGFPIIPVAHNAGKFWPKGLFVKNSGTIKIIVGKPILPNNMSSKELNHHVEYWIENNIDSDLS